MVLALDMAASGSGETSLIYDDERILSELALTIVLGVLLMVVLFVQATSNKIQNLPEVGRDNQLALPSYSPFLVSSCSIPNVTYTIERERGVAVQEKGRTVSKTCLDFW
ncbi:hypothetical protein H0G86_009728 [Trichoderma simmonsii]|uniref:Uncharacterized protein n=1 Tax=Trichoderma simmonsii TaxID=1491479 RepID=A0A8G0LK02_9HYPO|nr:hypothetical protein H0G86_009728 [Trichoderma simmonsii]